MVGPELTPTEVKALRSLVKEPQTKTALTKGLEADSLAKLVTAGWIAEIPLAKGGRVPKFTITDAGRQAIERLPVVEPAKAKAVRASRGATADSETLRQIIAMKAEFAEFRAEHRADLAELRTLLTTLVASSKNNAALKAVSAVPFDPIVFRKALRTTISEIDRRDHHDGLVPIGKVRRTLAYLGLDRPTFDAALLEEERAYTVDLKVANDPTRVKEPEGGISVEGRGLLYFVVIR